MSFLIAILRDAYQPDLQGLEAPKFYEVDDKIIDFDSADEAFAKVGELDDAVYYTSHGESGRPKYLVVDDVSANYIISGRGGDMGNYNWDSADCDCGECSTCFAMMIDQDRDFLKDNALTQKKS